MASIDLNIVLIIVGILWLILSSFAVWKLWYRLKDIIFMKWAAFFGFCSGIFIILMGYLSYNNIPHYYILDGCVYIILDVVMLMLYFYFEGLLNIRPPLTRYTFFIIIFMFNIFAIIFSIFFFHTVVGLLFFIFVFGFWVSMFGLYVLMQNFKLHKSSAIKLDILTFSIVLLSSIILILVEPFLIFNIMERESIEITLFYLFGNLLLFVAVGSFIFNSYFNGDDVHFIPVQVHAILIYNRGGLCIFNRSFEENENIFQVSEDLVSGALHAFSSFFNEILGSNAKLGYINAGDYEFLFSEIKEDQGTLVLIAGKANYYIKQSLSRFARLMPDDIIRRLNKDGVNLNSDIELTKYIKEIFPYLNIN